MEAKAVDDPQKRDEAVRYKRVIKEQVYLLRHASGTAMGDFLQQKLGQTLDRQLKAMVDGGLKTAFATLREAVNEKERTLAEKVLGSRDAKEKQIANNVRQYRQEMQENQQLIQSGEKMLQQSDVAVLESVQAHKLLSDLQKAVMRDNSTTEQMIKDFMELDKQEVTNLGGVLRAVERLGVGKRRTGQDAGGDLFRSAVKTPPLDTSRITFVGAFQISLKAVDSKIQPFESKGVLDPKEPMSSLVEELGRDLSENFSQLHEYASALFKNYNQTGMKPLSSEEMQKLTYEAVDCIAEEFELISNAKYSYPELRSRLDSIPKITRGTFAVSWAMWVEKAMERALHKMAASAKDSANTGVFALDGDADDAEEKGIHYVD